MSTIVLSRKTRKAFLEAIGQDPNSGVPTHTLREKVATGEITLPAGWALSTVARVQGEAPVRTPRKAPVARTQCAGSVADGSRCQRMVKGEFCHDHDTATQRVNAQLRVDRPLPKKGDMVVLDTDEVQIARWWTTLRALAATSGTRVDGWSLSTLLNAPAWVAWANEQREAGLSPKQVIAQVAR